MHKRCNGDLEFFDLGTGHHQAARTSTRRPDPLAGSLAHRTGCYPSPMSEKHPEAFPDGACRRPAGPRPSRLLAGALVLSAWLLLAHPGCGPPIAGEPPQDAGAGAIRALAERLEPPPGFQRVAVAPDSFGAWLRLLPVRPGRPRVHLYNGLPKLNQRAHHAVIAIDVGDRDLQQCADAIIRLRAEYLRARRCEEAIAFHFTSGDLARWSDWRMGSRPRLRGNEVSWQRTGSVDDGYRSFREYLDVVFTYAGSASLDQELRKVEDPARVEIGDVFIQGGFPGHAVLVVDVVERPPFDGPSSDNGPEAGPSQRVRPTAASEKPRGERRFVLAQSFMPAQEIHILRRPGSRDDPWYQARSEGEIETPEWRFRYGDLKRFPKPAGCGAEGSGIDFGSHPWRAIPGTQEIPEVPSR